MFIKKWLERHLTKNFKKHKSKNSNDDEYSSNSSKDKDDEFSDFSWEIYEYFDLGSILIEDYFYPEFYENSTNLLNFQKCQVLFSSSNEVEKNKFINKSLKDRPKYSLDDFEKLKLIGRGYYGKVYLVRNKLDNKKYALKSLKKKMMIQGKELEHLDYERKILEIVDHPFIIELKSILQTDEKVYFLTEYYSGGELFYHLRTLHTFSHELTQFYFAQIVLAIEFLHYKKIIYRDLKPENIVLDDMGYLKLTDFGLAKDNIEEHGSTSTFCGTNEYLAPEIILGESYGKPVDVWCLGILLYEMYFGIPPFFDTNKEKLFKKIMFSDVDFKLNKIIQVSNECKDLIIKLLDKNQKTRIKVQQIRNHPYFKNFDFDSLINKTMKPPVILSIDSQEDKYNECNLKYLQDNFGSNHSTKSEEKIMKKSSIDS